MKNTQKRIPNWNHLWTSELAFIDVTSKELNERFLEHGNTINYAGNIRDLGYKKIAPSVYRVYKKRII